MSHSVYILDSLSKLQTLEQVLTSFHELQSIQDGEVGQGLLAFARKLEELAPQIEPENEYLSSLYAGLEQLVKENYKRLLPVDMPPNEWVSTLKLMVEIAKEVNVAIWDDSIGMAFLPNGKILPNDKAKLWKNAITEMEQVSDFPTTLSAFKKFAQPKIEALAFQHGFCQKGKNEVDGYTFYEKKCGEIVQRFSAGFWGGGEFCMIAGVSIHCKSIRDIYSKFLFTPVTGSLGENIIFPNIDKEYNSIGSSAIKTVDEFFECLTYIEEHMLPLFEAVQSIKGLDLLLNGDLAPSIRDGAQHRFYMPHCLIIARLANNPQFEELCTSLGTYGEGSNRNWGANASARESEWPKLVKYLREEVKPLV